MKRLLLLGVLALLAALVAAAVAAIWGWRLLHQPYQGYRGERLVSVAPGTSAAEILEQLADQGILRDPRLARAYLVYRLDDPPLQAGEYRFDEPLDTPRVLDRLIRGQVIRYPMTVIEGLTLEETAETIARQGFGDAAALIAQMRRPERIAELDPRAKDLEGYLFPETYSFVRGTPESEIVDVMVATFLRNFRDRIEPRLDPSASTARQLVTLASVVEKEARLDQERALIAGVYAHRLRIGMPLQADPTVIFALKRRGEWDGNLQRPDLKLDSPYNTYVYPGLPPGPICSPGLASLEAAARPEETKYLYFVSRNDGSHVFAENLREHNRNVTKWQKLYWQKRWAEEASK